MGIDASVGAEVGTLRRCACQWRAVPTWGDEVGFRRVGIVDLRANGALTLNGSIIRDSRQRGARDGGPGRTWPS